MSNQRQSRDNRQVTPEWIAEVNQALQDQGMTRLELAKKVGASSGGISHLLNGNVGTSHLVPKITQVLRINSSVPEGLDAEIMREVRLLEHSDKENILGILRSLTAKLDK